MRKFPLTCKEDNKCGNFTFTIVLLKTTIFMQSEPKKLYQSQLVPLCGGWLYSNKARIETQRHHYIIANVISGVYIRRLGKFSKARESHEITSNTDDDFVKKSPSRNNNKCDRDDVNLVVVS